VKYDKNRFKTDQEFLDYWHPNQVLGLCDSVEEAIILNKFCFPQENPDWTQQEIDDLFDKYRIDINFPKEIKQIIDE